MKTTMRSALAACALVITVSACGSNEVTVPTGDGEISVTDDGSGITIESEDGSVTGGSGSLPDGFPTDAVPLVDGQILSAVAVDQSGGSGWSVTVLVDGSVADVQADAVAALEGAGFTSEGSLGSATGGTAVLSNGTYEVLVATTSQEPQAVITYTVAKGS